MSNAAKWLAGVILALAFFIGLAFLVPAIQLKVLKMYGTEFESVKTDIYRENKSYVEGTIRDIRELRVDYEAAEGKHRQAIRALILHRVRELDWDRFPSDIKDFLKEVEGE